MDGDSGLVVDSDLDVESDLDVDTEGGGAVARQYERRSKRARERSLRIKGQYVDGEREKGKRGRTRRRLKNHGLATQIEKKEKTAKAQKPTDLSLLSWSCRV